MRRQNRVGGVGGKKATMTNMHRRGSIHELVAATALSDRGYDVFFPLLHTSEIDFIATRGVETLRVQVKTAYYSNTGGGYVYLTTRTGRHHYKKDSFDVLMVVGPDRRVWMIPWSIAYTHTSMYFDGGKIRGKRGTFEADAWLIQPGTPK